MRQGVIKKFLSGFGAALGVIVLVFVGAALGMSLGWLAVYHPLLFLFIVLVVVPTAVGVINALEKDNEEIRGN